MRQVIKFFIKLISQNGTLSETFQYCCRNRASFSLYKFDVGQTIKKINEEKEQLFSGLEEENYFEVKFELFTDTNLFFDK